MELFSLTARDFSVCFFRHFPWLARSTFNRVVVDRFTGKSRGFGFITFAEADAADAALESMNGCEVDGRYVLFWQRCLISAC